MSYLVHLQQFEGPLGLLLHLIRKDEMDIMDINIGEITRQYLDYIRMMKELDLEVAGDFVAMAATLIQIKSKMLLPNYDEEGADGAAAEDPRRELVQKLLDYQKYQEAAKKLYERPLLNRDIYARGVREDYRDEDAFSTVIVEDDGLFSLISSYRRIVKKAARAVHKVRPKVQSIASRINELRTRFVVGARLTLNELLGGGAAARTQLLVTFLSMLELGRMGFVSIFQNETYGDIHIETKKPIEEDALERVQEFDSMNADSVAASIITNAIDEKIDMYETMMAEGPTEEEAGQLALVDAAPIGEGPLSETFVETDKELFESFSAAGDVATDDEIAAAEADLGFDADGASTSKLPEPGVGSGEASV